MEFTPFPSASQGLDDMFDDRFLDAPLPLMSFPTSSSAQRTKETPKTGMVYQLPPSSEQGCHDPDILMPNSNCEFGSAPPTVSELEPLSDVDLCNTVSALLCARDKLENVICLDDLENPSNNEPSPNTPHSRKVYDFDERAQRQLSQKEPTVAKPSATPPSYCLTFNSFFESGNLQSAHHVNGRSPTLSPSPSAPSAPSPPPPPSLPPVHQEYDLKCRCDTHTGGNIQWFYFSAAPPPTCTFPLKVRFNLINMMKKGSLYQWGMRPLMHSQLAGRWARGGEEVAYFRNKHSSESKGEEARAQSDEQSASKSSISFIESAL